jgi:hypothetical protein
MNGDSSKATASFINAPCGGMQQGAAILSLPSPFLRLHILLVP